jgi:hypothetical protein
LFLDPGDDWHFFLPYKNTAAIFYYQIAVLVRYQTKKRHTMPGIGQFLNGESDMGDKGSKDKGKKEKQKKAQRTPKEKRKAKQEKKNK